MNTPKLRFKEFTGEWKISKLADFARFQQGVQVDLDLQKKEVKEGFVKFLRIENYTQLSNDFRFIDNKISKGKKINKNEIAIVRYGASAGFIARGHEGVLANNLFKLIVNNNEIDYDYLYQYLKRDKVYSFFQAEMAGGAMPALSFEIVKRLKFPFTSLPEQQKIASFYTAVDQKLTVLKKKKELLEQYKKGVMQQIFSQKLRFKDENGNPFPEWEEKKLGEVILKKSSNISANSLEDNEGEYIIYGATGVLKKVDFYSEEQPYISIVKDGAGVGRLFLCEKESSVLGTLDLLFPKDNNVLSFLYYLLETIDFNKYKTGSTIPHIYFKDYSLENVVIPSVKEQQKIADFLNAIDNKINAVAQQIEKTEQWKKGLLQKMFV